MRGAAEQSWPETLYFAADEEVREAATEQLPALLATGVLNAYTLAWVETMEEWGALGEPSTLEHLGPVVDQDVQRLLRARTSSGTFTETHSDKEGAERLALLEGGPSADEESAVGGSTDENSLESDCGSSPGSEPFCSVRYVDPRTNAPSDEVSVDRLRRALADGDVTAQGLVWTDGMDDWTPLCDCFERFGLVRAELGIMRQHMELKMSEASAAHRREIRTAVAGTDWDRVEVCHSEHALPRHSFHHTQQLRPCGEQVVERADRDCEKEQDEGEREVEVYFVHRETGESAWELDATSSEQAAAAAAGVVRPSSGGWLARENKTLCAENARLRKELEAAQAERGVALRQAREMKRQAVALQQENTALRGRLQPPHV